MDEPYFDPELAEALNRAEQVLDAERYRAERIRKRHQECRFFNPELEECTHPWSHQGAQGCIAYLLSLLVDESKS